MITSPYPDETIPDVSVFDFLFADLSEDDAGRTAIVDGTSGAETIFGDLRRGIESLAGALAARAIGTGDVVALHSPNIPAFATVFHGILRSGATATTVNALYTAEEIETQLRDSGAVFLFTVGALAEPALAAAAAVGLSPERVVVLDGRDGHAGLADLLGEGHDAPVVDIDPATHVAVMPYSSGTTGYPKGVRLSHRNLVANVVQTYPLLDVESTDVVLAVLPFFHIYGMTVLLDIALKRRATLVTMPRFDLARFLELIQTHGCTYLFIAPPIAVALAKHPLVAEYDLGTVRAIFSGAAPADAGLMGAVAERVGARVRQGYGMSEASPVTHAGRPDRDDLSLGSIGVPVANTEVRLVDIETGADIDVPTEGISEPGEVWVRGPQVMLGYLGREDATRETVDEEGWLHTGDIGTVGAQGEFYIVDRLKELIKYKGYQVAPAELEALLLTHPDIVDAAVVGAPDADGQEIPKAFVVQREGAALDAATVEAFVAEHVAPHKKVRAVEFIETVPKSASGKILRKDLRG
ncbi:4-coumarate--CoA ligase [Labedella gwakjiensis]|uniref:4-coumarate--CoA ligase n=1 Tax=Labedella gwakjiensis TaxID=390269 RepID=A0A2P8GS78_9MICO|nr:AMP-binding protein [Labedella gwakjiensis]PSL36818.1 4-coumarate--CoA ligase [Labedella gwakjiensis]RUQ84325.1 4-coumarate--CoA ligase family protein [Labedella gwakjiensis]